MIKETTTHSLDTLEVTSDYYKTKAHESQYHQAIRKQVQIAKLKQIIDVTDSSRAKQYWKTYHCNRVKLQQGKKLVGSLCRKRWCHHCNRIKTAELVQAYKQPLQELQEQRQLYLVTLTAPTVKARELRSEIIKRLEAFQRIKDNIRKNYNLKLVGVRKTEVTYNENKDWYHPHFHLIVQGKVEGELILSLWYKQFKNSRATGQDIRPIIIEREDGKNGLVEVFKYATKDVTKDIYTAKAMDNIYRALDGLRTIQTYGSIRKVKEPLEAKNEGSIVDWIAERNDIWVFDEDTADYYDALNNTMIGTQELTQEILFNTTNSMELLE